jgi:hypothetical protein
MWVECVYTSPNRAYSIILSICSKENKDISSYVLLDGRNYSKVIVEGDYAHSITLQEKEILSNYDKMCSFDTYRGNFGLCIKRIKDNKFYPDAYLIEYKKFCPYSYKGKNKFNNINLNPKKRDKKYHNYIQYGEINENLPWYSNCRKILDKLSSESIVIGDVEYKLYKNIETSLISSIKRYSKLNKIKFIDNNGIKDYGYIVKLELKYMR